MLNKNKPEYRERAINLLLAIDKYAREHDEPVDWSKDDSYGLNPKWKIIYLHGEQYVQVGSHTETIKPGRKIVAEPAYTTQILGATYFNSKEVCEEAIRRFNSELVWYFTKYWEAN